MREYIVPVANTDITNEGMYIGFIRTRHELIRCKDCKHWRANTQFCSVFSSLSTAHRMPPDGYCSEAERKEENE